MDSITRLSLNQITTERASLGETVDACARHGVPYVAVWRHKLAETGVARAVRLIRDAGIRVSSLCRGGMFPAATPAERAARSMVADGIAALVPYAAERRVRLGIEPLHPAFAAERSCITTLREARALATKFDPATVGIVADVYHIWWDPALYREIARAAGRFMGFHVSDWLVPSRDVLMCRGMMGDGVIELQRIRTAVQDAGYAGPIEVEIFNDAVWSTPLDTLLPLVKERYLACV